VTKERKKSLYLQVYFEKGIRAFKAQYIVRLLKMDIIQILWLFSVNDI
jgi:hypothetical protein